MENPYDGCSVEELTEAAEQLAAMQAAVHGQLLRILAALDAVNAWEEDYSSCMESWTAARLGVKWATAAAWVRTARSLEQLPAMTEAYADGALSWDKVCDAADVATPENEAQLAEELAPMTAKQATNHCRHLRRETTEEAEESHRKRGFGLRWDRDRSGARPYGWLPADAAAVVDTAVNRKAESAGPKPDGTYDPIDMQRADALVDICAAGLAGDAEPDRATVVVHAQVDALRGDGWAELANGVPVASETLRRLMCDCRLQVLALDESGQAVVLSEAARTVSPRMRRVLFQRDQGCIFPGCERVRFLHAHHRRFRRHHGPTSVDNLDLLCRYHHRLVHEGGWSYERRDDGTVEVYRPDGRPLLRPRPGLRPEIRASFPLIARE